MGSAFAVGLILPKASPAQRNPGPAGFPAPSVTRSLSAGGAFFFEQKAGNSNQTVPGYFFI